MLNHPTLDKLHHLRLPGMARAFAAQLGQSDCAGLSFEERLGLLVDEECTLRDETRLKTRLRTAALRQTACLEDIDFRHPRGLDKALVKKLGGGTWLREHMNRDGPDRLNTGSGFISGFRASY